MKTIITFLLLTTTIHAQTIFDSGTPTGRYGAAIGGGLYCELEGMPWSWCKNWIATEVAFRDTAGITGIQAYLSSINEGVSYEADEGVITLNLYSDGGNTPGNRLKQASFFVDDQQLGWFGPDLDWQLEPGEYWVALEVSRDSKFTGGWKWDAPTSTLAQASQRGDFWTNTEVWNPSTEQASYGLRIAGYVGEGAAGDINRDGEFTLIDLDLLGEGLKAGSNDQLYDVDQSTIPLRNDWFSLVEKIGVEPGDADADGLFNSTDLLQIFQSGEYEDAVTWNSTWSEGDWNADFDFTSSDLILALATGSYELPPAASVPEPSGQTILIVGLLGILLVTRLGRSVLSTLLWIVLLPLSLLGWILATDLFQENH